MIHDDYSFGGLLSRRVFKGGQSEVLAFLIEDIEFYEIGDGEDMISLRVGAWLFVLGGFGDPFLSFFVGKS